MDFLALAQSCGPAVHPVTIAAIVRTESGFDPLVIRDNTGQITLHPRTLEQAQAIVRERYAAGHKLAIGLMQVTSPWALKLNLDPIVLLNACTNMKFGTAILAINYQKCSLSNRAPTQALNCALSMYWSGRPHVGGAYTNRIFQAAGNATRVPETAGVSDGLLAASGTIGQVPPFNSFQYRTRSYTYMPPASSPFSFR